MGRFTYLVFPPKSFLTPQEITKKLNSFKKQNPGMWRLKQLIIEDGGLAICLQDVHVCGDLENLCCEVVVVTFIDGIMV